MSKRLRRQAKWDRKSKRLVLRPGQVWAIMLHDRCIHSYNYTFSKHINGFKVPITVNHGGFGRVYSQDLIRASRRDAYHDKSMAMQKVWVLEPSDFRLVK